METFAKKQNLRGSRFLEINRRSPFINVIRDVIVDVIPACDF